MRLRTELSPAGVLLATLDGQFELEEAAGLYRAVMMEAARAGSEAVLMDCRRLAGSPGDMERYHFGVAAAAAHNLARERTGNAPRVALLGDEPLLERRRFGETVATNRGAMVRVCGSVDEAAAWLEVAPAELTRAEED